MGDLGELVEPRGAGKAEAGLELGGDAFQIRIAAVFETFDRTPTDPGPSAGREPRG
jgi:hypothetical protein